MNKTISNALGTKMFPKPPSDEALICPYCNKKPSELREYIECSEELGITPEKYVRQEEGTYCQFTGCFMCTSCYVMNGTPLNTDLHQAFPYYRMEVNPLEGQDNNALVKYRLGEL